MRSSDSINDLYAALVKAQGSIVPPAKKKTAKVTMKSGGTYTFAYADLGDVLDAVRGPFAANGLAVMQGIGFHEGKTVLHTRIVHQSGQWSESDYPLNMTGNPQERGSELTYARRYALAAIGGFAPDDDDDANAASGNNATITSKARQTTPKPANGASQPLATPEQVQRLRDLAIAAKLPTSTREKWLEKAGVKEFAEMPQSIIEKCIAYAENQLKKQQPKEQEPATAA